LFYVFTAKAQRQATFAKNNIPRLQQLMGIASLRLMMVAQFHKLIPNFAA
jgi:hypothetical protein